MEKLISRHPLLTHGLIGGKGIDSYFQLLEKMAMEPQNISKRESVYWIAIIDLSLINETETRYALQFPCGHEFVPVWDEIAVRDETGAIMQFVPTLYDLSEVHDELLRLKENGAYQYVFCLMHETVKYGAGHHVYLMDLPMDTPAAIGYFSNSAVIDAEVRRWAERLYSFSRSYTKEDFKCVLAEEHNSRRKVHSAEAAVAA